MPLSTVVRVEVGSPVPEPEKSWEHSLTTNFEDHRFIVPVFHYPEKKSIQPMQEAVIVNRRVQGKGKNAYQ